MQYNKNIEAASDFIENIKDYPKQCVLLGVVIGGPYRYLPWEIENYYNTLMQSNDECERMNDFFTAHGLAALDPSEQTKQLCKEREKIADKTHSKYITKLLWEIREKEAISEKEKEDLVTLISESTFTKFGILLSSHLSYDELSSCTLKGIDAQLYKIFAPDKFEHVLRQYYYCKEGYGNATIEENIYRFNYGDYTIFMNGEVPLTDVDPDLQNVPFFQLGPGKTLLKFTHEGGSRTGGYYYPTEMQTISFNSAMVILKVPQSLDCEIKQ